MARAVLKSAVPAVLVAVIVLVPFLDKAFTIDDTTLMMMAEHALLDPLHPAAFEIAWDRDMPVRATGPTGPIMGWILLPAAFFGSSERIAHLIVLAILLIAVLATVSLALRLGLSTRAARWAGLLLVSTPAVLGLAGTAMPDIPAMALGVLGLERLLAWKQERRGWQAVVAASSLGIAPLVRPHAALLLGIGALLLVDNFTRAAAWRSVPRRGWLILLTALFITTAAMAITRDPAAGSATPISVIVQMGSSNSLPSNLVSFASYWVMLLPLALPWLAMRWRVALSRGWVLGNAFVLAFFFSLKFGLHYQLLTASLAALGVSALWDVLSDAWSRRDETQGALGLWLLVALPVVTYVHFPCKYLVASAPAVAMLVARAAELHAGRAGRIAVGVAVGAGVCLGVAILRADAAFSGLARRAVAELISPHVLAGRTVWYAGHWGFQWYAEKAGARYLSLAPPHPVRGDLLVTTLRSMPSPTVELYPERERIDRVTDSAPGGRVVVNELGVNFFSNFDAVLPWIWSDAVIDQFDLFLITQDGPLPHEDFPAIR